MLWRSSVMHPGASQLQLSLGVGSGLMIGTTQLPGYLPAWHMRAETSAVPPRCVPYNLRARGRVHAYGLSYIHVGSGSTLLPGNALDLTRLSLVDDMMMMVVGQEGRALSQQVPKPLARLETPFLPASLFGSLHDPLAVWKPL
jgi:hypothetical protein